MQVSIRASAWEATRHLGVRRLPAPFQSAPPRGRRRAEPGQVAPGFEFQSAPPRGRRHGAAGNRTRPVGFQSAPPRGRRHPRARPGGGGVSFNPRLRVGGDQSRGVSPMRSAFVSIRASAWEATPRPRVPPGWLPVSIRASAWEATREAAADQAAGEFQSAPPRGRRPARRRRIKRLESFNPRLRVGGDSATRRRAGGAQGFNPRLRVGGDARDRDPRGRVRGFNPRLRVGGDVSALAAALN